MEYINIFGYEINKEQSTYIILISIGLSVLFHLLSWLIHYAIENRLKRSLNHLHSIIDVIDNGGVVDTDEIKAFLSKVDKKRSRKKWGKKYV